MFDSATLHAHRTVGLPLTRILQTHAPRTCLPRATHLALDYIPGAAPRLPRGVLGIVKNERREEAREAKKSEKKEKRRKNMPYIGCTLLPLRPLIDTPYPHADIAPPQREKGERYGLRLAPPHARWTEAKR